MKLLPVSDAIARILSDAGSLEVETVGLLDGYGRFLREDIEARLTQPPFDASSMDGYAVRAEDVASPPVELDVVGQSAAGSGFEGSVGAGQAARIFTGAPMPKGADCVVIQENTETLTTGDGAVRVRVLEAASEGRFVRPRGFDFHEGDCLIGRGRVLTARDLAMAATMGHGTLNVTRRPKVGVLSTGNELVPPGATPGPDQIIASNSYGLAPMIESAGGEAELLGIARDTRASLDEHIERAQGCDILVTIGGASVGDHDLVSDALQARGLELDFWKIAMRPGKPLMFGRLERQFVLGLPGNPVSSYVCGLVFLVPLIRRLLGHDRGPAPLERARLAHDLEANGPRQHYMRARFEKLDGDQIGVRAYSSQDSARMALLHEADCLIVRPSHAPALAKGAEVEILRLG